MTQLLSDLKNALVRIEKFETWCQTHEALNSQGKPASAAATIAQCYCGIGSVRALSHSESNRAIRIGACKLRSQVASLELYGRDVSSVNDGVGLPKQMNPRACHNAVVAIYALAIEKEESRV